MRELFRFRLKRVLIRAVRSAFSHKELNLLNKRLFIKELRRNANERNFFAGSYKEIEQMVISVIDNYKFLLKSNIGSEKLRQIYIKKILDTIYLRGINERTLYVFQHGERGYGHKEGKGREYRDRYEYFYRRRFRYEIVFYHPIDEVIKEINNKFPLFNSISPFFRCGFRHLNGKIRKRKNEKQYKELAGEFLKKHKGHLNVCSQVEYRNRCLELLLKEIKKK